MTRLSIRVEKMIQRATLMKNSGHRPSIAEIEAPGAAESRKAPTDKPCPYCKRGWKIDRKGEGWEPCDDCDGSGIHHTRGNAG